MGPGSFFLTNMCSANWDLIHHMSNPLEHNDSPANWNLTNLVSSQLELNCSCIWEPVTIHLFTSIILKAPTMGK